MASGSKTRFRRFRVHFRRFRIAIWLVVLVFAGLLLYLNQVGLPAFVKKPLLENLRARGLDLQFTRLRLSWQSGLVADNVQVGQAGQPQSPYLTAKQAIVYLNYRAMLRLRLLVDGVALRQGQMTWPLHGSDNPKRKLSLENIQTDLRFLPGDQWRLNQFQARLAGIRLFLSGNVTNASILQKFRSARKAEESGAEAWRRRLTRLADTLEKTRFQGEPQLRLDVTGDAVDIRTFAVLLIVKAPGAETPWGQVNDADFSAWLHPITNQAISHATLSLDARDASTQWASASHLKVRFDVTSAEGLNFFSQAVGTVRADSAFSRWGTGTNLNLAVALQTPPGQTNLVHGNLDLHVDTGQSPWAAVNNCAVKAQWTHSITNPVPILGTADLKCDNLQSRWAAGTGLELHLNMTNRPASDTSLTFDRIGWWTNLEPYAIQWSYQAQELSVSNLLAKSVSSQGQWKVPDLVLSSLHGIIGDGQLRAAANLNIDSREASARVEADFDARNAESLLTPAAKRWLAQFNWQQAPWVKGELSLTLPHWTNSAPDWREETRPTLKLRGQFIAKDGGSYRGLAVQTARSHFSYSNLCWHLPDLFVTRPEGTLAAEHRADERTKDFYWRIRSTLDPIETSPILGSKAIKIKDLCTFTEPPVIEGEVWGRYRNPALTVAKGRVAVTNFTFRGESFSGLQTTADFSNAVLRVFDPRVQRGDQRLAAEGLLADFTEQKVFITNAFCTVDVMPVARAIGAQVARAVQPYKFSSPPTIHVSGVVPMRGEEKADARFIVEGGPFNWENFHIPKIVGNLHWKGMELSVTKVNLSLYGGDANGFAFFRFKKDQPAQYEFAVTTTNTLLRPLLQDVFTTTNHVEGLLSGNLVVTHGSAEDWRLWDGYGSLRLQDGLIWDIPMFGVLSPILNSIAPGLGNSRANSATCSFNMTNGVLHSDNLEIRSSGMRLQYRGTADLYARMNARVEAELLRDMWIVGPLVSTVFWPVSKMFEYKVTGTLGDPKLEPVYLVPKLMQLPFAPFRALRGLFPDDSRTNAPPSNFSE